MDGVEGCWSVDNVVISDEEQLAVGGPERCVAVGGESAAFDVDYADVGARGERTWWCLWRGGVLPGYKVGYIGARGLQNGGQAGDSVVDGANEDFEDHLLRFSGVDRM